MRRATQGSGGAAAAPVPTIGEDEVVVEQIRAQGAGGQNVNKVSNAVHLRFDIAASSLDPVVKQRLLMLDDQRVTRDGVIVIKAQRFRSLDKNRADALARLNRMVRSAAIVRLPRIATRPTRASQQRRLETKVKRGHIKALRGRVGEG
jgi:ribosome-associated protein